MHFQPREGPSRGLLRDCEIFGNIRITFVSSTSHYPDHRLETQPRNPHWCWYGQHFYTRHYSSAHRRSSFSQYCCIKTKYLSSKSYKIKNFDTVLTYFLWGYTKAKGELLYIQSLTSHSTSSLEYFQQNLRIVIEKGHLMSNIGDKERPCSWSTLCYSDQPSNLLATLLLAILAPEQKWSK